MNSFKEKKWLWIILVLLLVVFLWLYFKPEAPAVENRAVVSDVSPKNNMANTDSNDGEDVEIDDWEDAALAWQDDGPEDQVDPFVPEQVIADVDDWDVNNLPVNTATHRLVDGSKIDWLGKKVGGQHNWFVPVKSGTIMVDSGKVVAGEFVIDMTGIKATDIESETLDETMKEWFNVAEHPEATFSITNVAATQVSWVMTINWISKQITFPATVIVEEGNVIARAEFALDRNEWNVAWWTPAVSEFMELSFVLLWTQI